MKLENKFFLEMIKIIVKENMGQTACFLIKISLNGSNTSVFPKRQHMSFFKKNWDSLHARLNSHSEAWSYKKKKHKKVKAYRKSV